MRGKGARYPNYLKGENNPVTPLVPKYRAKRRRGSIQFANWLILDVPSAAI